MSGRSLIAGAWAASANTTNSFQRVGCIAADASFKVLSTAANSETAHAEENMLAELAPGSPVQYVAITCWPCIRCAARLAALDGLQVVFYDCIGRQRTGGIALLEERGIRCELIKAGDGAADHPVPPL